MLRRLSKDACACTLVSGYNEAKYEILSLLDELGEATSGDVAEITGRSIYGASRNLGRYYRQGILDRYREDGEYVYSLNDRGSGRLKWLEEVFEEEYEEEIKRLVEAIRNRCRVRRQKL